MQFSSIILAKHCPDTGSENYKHFNTFSMYIKVTN